MGADSDIRVVQRQLAGGTHAQRHRAKAPEGCERKGPFCCLTVCRLLSSAVESTLDLKYLALMEPAPADRPALRGRRVWHAASALQNRVGPLFAWLHGQAWSILAGLALLATVLGIWGFRLHFEAQGEAASFWRAVYLTLQLFPLNSGAVDGAVEWQLEVARFLAPLVAAGAALRALAVLFYDRTQLFLLRLFGHDHVIVCGLGRKGATLVEELRRREEWVVVIESDPLNPQIDRCRELGASVILGSSTDRYVLDQAYVHRAKALVVLTGRDGANVETAVLARQLNGRRRRGRLRCVVHVTNRRLHRVLRGSEIATRESDPFDLELFSVFEKGADLMLHRVLGAHGSTLWSQPQHLLIVGFGQMGEALLLRAFELWNVASAHKRAGLRITVFDEAAAVKRARLMAHQPQVFTACDVRFEPIDVRLPQFEHGKFLDDDPSLREVSAAFVCLGDDSLSMCAALSLVKLLEPRRVPVLARMAEHAGLAAAFRVNDGDRGLVEGVLPVGLLEVTCNAAAVLGETSSVALGPGSLASP